MSYKNSKGLTHDSDTIALIDKVRALAPNVIAPEVYGLRVVLAKEPATTVLKLMELDNATLDTWDVEVDGKKIDQKPLKTETYREWKQRTTFSEEYDGRAETNAYTNIGYDWVNWAWLPPGQSPLTASKKRYEIIDRTTFNPKTQEEYDVLYAKSLAVSPGNSGSADPSKGEFKIRTFAPSVEKLKNDGFKGLHFNNGGDDDVLVVDHKRKEFAFFEDYAPPRLTKDPKYSGSSLQSLYNEHNRSIS